MFEDYKKVCRGGDNITLEIEGIGEVEGKWFDGTRINPTTIPSGKYAYQTRHDCDDWSAPISIAPHNHVLVDFCATFVTDEPIAINDEVKVLDYCFG